MIKLLVSVLIVISTQGKVIEDSLNVQQMRRAGGWHFLARVTFSPGPSTVTLQTRLQGIPLSNFDSVQLAIVEQSEWERQPNNKCNCIPQRQSRQQIKFNGDPTFLSMSFTEQQPKTYFLAIRDCDNRLINESGNYRLHILYKLTVINNNGHLDHHDWHLFVPMAMVVTAFLFYRLLKNRNQQQETESVQIVLLLGLGTRVVALFWKGLYSWLIWNQGSIYKTLQFVYLVAHSISQSLIMSLLLFLCFGWGITFTKCQDYEIYMPVMVLFSLTSLLFAALGIINQSQHDKYHMFDSIPGILQIFFKVIVAIVFCGGIWNTVTRHKQANRGFMFKFLVMGALYILSMPLTYFVTEFLVTESKQQSAALLLNEFIQLVCSMVFTHELTAKNSLYRSCLNTRTFLPTDSKRF